MAGRQVCRVGIESEQGRVLNLADALGDRAARVEAASGRDVDGAGWLATQPQLVRGLVAADSRCGGQHGSGVRMPRVIEDDVPPAVLGGPAEVHDRDAVAEIPDDGEIMRDEDESEPEPRPELGEKLQDSRLHRHIQRRDWLVRYYRAGRYGERPGGREPLPLAAGGLAGGGVPGTRGPGDHCQ